MTTKAKGTQGTRTAGKQGRGRERWERWEVEVDNETAARVTELARKAGMSKSAYLGKLVVGAIAETLPDGEAKTAGMPPEEQKEPRRRRHLVIVADMPEAWGNAFEYGDGRMDTWLEDAFTCCMEGDFGDPDDEAWKEDVERLFGVCEEGARDAFDVRAVGFVDGDVAATVRKLVEQANAPAVPENPNQMKIEAVEAAAAGAEVAK